MLSIDASLIVVFLIVWVLVAILTKIFFNPLRKIRGERKAEIEKNKRAADAARESFEEKSLQIEEQLKEARAMAQAAREKYENEELKEKERLLEETHRQCRTQVEDAKKGLKSQLERLKKELESSSRLLAERIEKRILN